MNAPAAMRAAAEALRAGGTPLHEATAAWLDDTAAAAEIRIDIWNRCEQPGAGLDVPGLIHAHYRYPLAVAQAVIEEVRA